METIKSHLDIQCYIDVPPSWVLFSFVNPTLQEKTSDMKLKGQLTKIWPEEARHAWLYLPTSYKKPHRRAKVEHHPARKAM